MSILYDIITCWNDLMGNTPKDEGASKPKDDPSKDLMVRGILKIVEELVEERGNGVYEKIGHTKTVTFASLMYTYRFIERQGYIHNHVIIMKNIHSSIEKTFACGEYEFNWAYKLCDIYRLKLEAETKRLRDENEIDSYIISQTKGK